MSTPDDNLDVQAMVRRRDQRRPLRSGTGRNGLDDVVNRARRCPMNTLAVARRSMPARCEGNLRQRLTNNDGPRHN
jgi:hypothetical protein